VPHHAFVVLEDHPLVLGAITDHLNSVFPDATFSYTGAHLPAAVKAVTAMGATCAIVDLDLGGDRTPEAVVSELQAVTVPVVLISANDNALAIQKAIRRGAHCYVPKRLVIDQLRHAVTAAESGTVWMSPDFAAVLVPMEGSQVSLEPAQHRALALYAAGLPSVAIAARLHIEVAEVVPLVASALGQYRMAST